MRRCGSSPPARDSGRSRLRKPLEDPLVGLDRAADRRLECRVSLAGGDPIKDLQAHPQLLVRPNSWLLDSCPQEDRHAVAEDVADELRALHLSQLADRAGPQWGGAYVDPHDAADEMLDEIVQPSLDDLSRRARIGAVQAAREIGFGVLMGLYACRDEDDNDRVPMRERLMPSTTLVRRRSGS